MRKILLSTILCANMAFATLVDKSLSGSKYFRLFDYKKPENISKMMEFESKLKKLSLKVLDYVDKNPSYQAPKKKFTSRNKLAMILVYTSMLIMNSNNGAIEGKISYEQLKQFADNPEKDLRSEILRRYQFNNRILERAIELEPEDERIPAWYSSNKLRAQKYETGKVDPEIIDWIMEMTVESPIFHLFNALTMSSDYYFGDKHEDKLFEIVSKMNSKDSPCLPPIKFLRKGEAKKCNTTKKTPFAFQGTSVYFGDAYLKEFMRTNDSSKKEYLLARAKGAYQRPLFFKPIKTSKWGMKPHTKKRIEIIKSLQAGGKLDKDFFKTETYLDMYTCTSCHQNGKAPKALHINLP